MKKDYIGVVKRLISNCKETHSDKVTVNKNDLTMLLKLVDKLIDNKPNKKDELSILNELDECYKWISRDRNGLLHIHAQKPTKGNRGWGSCSKNMTLPFNAFDFIKWEDEEPYNIDDLLKTIGAEDE